MGAEAHKFGREIWLTKCFPHTKYSEKRKKQYFESPCSSIFLSPVSPIITSFPLFFKGRKGGGAAEGKKKNDFFNFLGTWGSWLARRGSLQMHYFFPRLRRLLCFPFHFFELFFSSSYQKKPRGEKCGNIPPQPSKTKKELFRNFISLRRFFSTFREMGGRKSRMLPFCSFFFFDDSFLR